MPDFPTTLVPTDVAAPTTALGNVSKNHTDHHQAVDERLGLIQADKLSRLAVSTTAPPTGVASGALRQISFPLPGSQYEQNGIDIAVNVGDTTRLDILTPGLYSLYVLATIGGTITLGDLGVSGFDPFSGVDIGFSEVSGQWVATFTETYYVPSPTSVQISLYAETSAGTWDAFGVDARIQRIQ